MLPRNFRYLSCIAILTCLIPFLPGIGGPFLHDDMANLRALQVGPFSLDTAIDVAFRNETGPLRRPLSNLSLATNLWLHGLTPFGFKLSNLLLHFACGVALLAFLQALLAGLKPDWEVDRRNRIALLATMLWVVHPLQVSTTLYIVQRMAQLPTLFLFILGWRFQHYLNGKNGSTRAARRILLEWLVLLVLAIASKENGALAPLLMAVLLAMHRSINPAAPTPPRWLVLITIALPIAAGAAILVSRPDLVMGGYAVRDFDAGQRLLTEAVVLWHYLGMWFVPYVPWMALYPDIPVFGAGDPSSWLAAGAWLMTLAIALLQRHRWPMLAFAILWFLCAHAMESTILPLELVYEHRNYLAFAGIALLTSTGIEAIAIRLQVRMQVIAASWLALLALATGLRAFDWSSIDRFAITEFRHHPRSERAINLMISRATDSGDSKQIAELRERLNEIAGGKTWPLAMDISIRCSQPWMQVQWGGLERAIRDSGTDNQTFKMLRQAAINVIAGHCPTVPAARLQHLLKTAYARAMADGNAGQAEAFGTYIGWISDRAGNTADAASWFQRLSNALPQATQPLFDLAYLELNHGKVEAAANALQELRHRQRNDPLIGYRIDELAAQVAMARREASGQEPKKDESP